MILLKNLLNLVETLQSKKLELRKYEYNQPEWDGNIDSDYDNRPDVKKWLKEKKKLEKEIKELEMTQI